MLFVTECFSILGSINSMVVSMLLNKKNTSDGLEKENRRPREILVAVRGLSRRATRSWGWLSRRVTGLSLQTVVHTRVVVSYRGLNGDGKQDTAAKTLLAVRFSYAYARG